MILFANVRNVKGEGKYIFRCREVATLSFTNKITYPHCFLTAYKMMSLPSILAGALD